MFRIIHLSNFENEHMDTCTYISAKDISVDGAIKI